MADDAVVNDLSSVPADASEVQRSSRDLDTMRARLETWLVGRLPDGAGPAVPELGRTSATGMSSETLLFEAAWNEAGASRVERLVARVAPDPADVPVFPNYYMDRQFEAIRLVGELSSVPVPRVRWYEPDPAVIGTPFFIMGRVDGDVPPDVMPYTFGGNWLFDADPVDHRRLQDATVDVLAELHAIDQAEQTFGFLTFDEPGPTRLRRHVAHAWAWYEYAKGSGPRSRIVERGFAWLEDHWPATEGPTVLSWGDSRIGNVMYQDFQPVAVLDWEMAGLAPREVDLGWLIYAHRSFQDMATSYGLPGMPQFMQPDEVAARYEQTTGLSVRDLDFYITYAGVQWGIVGLITGLRSVHFGEREMPEEVDDLLYNRPSLERLLAS